MASASCREIREEQRSAAQHGDTTHQTGLPPLAVGSTVGVGMGVGVAALPSVTRGCTVSQLGGRAVRKEEEKGPLDCCATALPLRFRVFDILSRPGGAYFSKTILPPHITSIHRCWGRLWPPKYSSLLHGKTPIGRLGAAQELSSWSYLASRGWFPVLGCVLSCSALNPLAELESAGQLQLFLIGEAAALR